MSIDLEQGTIVDVLRDPNDLYKGNLNQYLGVVANAPNIHHGYHDLRHMLHVTFICYKALEFYSDRKDPLEPLDARNLLIAALFHDYDHTGMPVKDSENIERAVLGLQAHISDEDRPQLLAISGIIRATQFPHIELPEDAPMAHRIIRDADLSQGLNTAWLGSIAEGLGAEQGKSVQVMLEETIGFLGDLHFETEFGRQVLGPKVGPRLEEARSLLEILSNPEY